jgi:WD domain, G-beta repeat
LADQPDGNPYVGPRPFERADQQLFFGRTREVRELVSLVIANRAVIVYAASGAGKTSLLNAGVLPTLEYEEGFEVLPVGRIAGLTPTDPSLAAAANVFTFSVLSNLAKDLAADGDGAAALRQVALAEYLRKRPHPVGDDELPAPRALLIDQFEELFTLHAEFWEQREPFMQQLAEALADDPLLRVVIAIREDYIARLESVIAPLPSRGRFRLDRLRSRFATEAVTGPLEKTSRSFADGVAQKLVADLLTFRVDAETGKPLEIEGEFVEPVHLQVVCRDLWDELPAHVDKITEDDLHEFGDADEALGRFYDRAIAEAAARGGIGEAKLRRALDDAFITTGGTRGTVYRAAAEAALIPSAAIDELENRHLICAEWRAGARWYELTHDRLIEPIQESNRRFVERWSQRRRRRQARLASLTAVPLLALGVIAAVGLIHRQSERAQAARHKAAFLERRLSSLGQVILEGHRGRVTSAVATPDKKTVATSNEDGTVRLWSLGGTPRTVLHQSKGPVYTVDVSRDGKLLVTAAEDGKARVWALHDRRLVRVLRAPAGALYTAAFSPDPSGREVVAGGSRRVAWIWDWRTGKIVQRLVGHKGLIETAVFSPNGRFVATASDDGSARLWDSSTGRQVERLRGGGGKVFMVAYRPDGRVIATTGGNGVRLWSAPTGKLVDILRAGKAPVYAIAFDPKEPFFLASASGDGVARIWDLRQRKPRVWAILSGHKDFIQGISFSKDGKLVLTASADATARIWDWKQFTVRVTKRSFKP